MHVVLAIDSLGSGGAQRQVVELAARLHAPPESRCSVLTYHPDDFYAGRLREAGVPHGLLVKGGRLDPGWWLRLRAWLAAERPDLVHAFLLTPAFWLGLAVRSLPSARRPVFVAAERNCLIATSRGLGALQRFVYRRADAVTVNAAPVAGSIERILGVPADHIHYLPNGIDLARWDADAEAPCPLELEPGCLHLALVGGLRPQKGHALLFEALSRLGAERTRDWRVWCIGGRTAGARAARSVEEEVASRGLGDRVRLCPPERNVAALMRRLDGLVLPSHYEGFPNVVLEAMASRLPVVATPVGDVPNLVENGVTGFLAPPGDPDALARALERLASASADTRHRMGLRARERVEQRFRMESVAARHGDLYRRLVAGR